MIETLFDKLNQYRVMAIRYDKLAETFLSAIYIAAVVIWLN
jgi:transposase